MAESKIILALAKFKIDYAWDKSLNVPAAITPSQIVQPSPPDTSIEDFINGQRTR